MCNLVQTDKTVTKFFFKQTESFAAFGFMGFQ